MSKKTETTDYKIGSVLSEIIRPKFPIIFLLVVLCFAFFLLGFLTFFTAIFFIVIFTVGLLAMLPHIASFIFLNIGGYFADYLTNKGVKLITVRKLCNTIAFGGSGICLCIVPELNSVAGVIAIMCLGNVFGGFSAGGFIVNHADIGPEHTGRLMGITNMFAAIPGFIGAIITGMILDATNSWDMVFYVVAGITFFGGIFYFLFASTEKQFD